MTAVRQKIFDEVELRFTTRTGAAEIEVMPAGDPAKFPALHIIDNGQRTIEAETGVTRKELNITVLGFVQGSFGKKAHAELNQLHADTVAALMDDGEQLGGLVEEIAEGDLRPDVAPLASKPRLAFGQDFKIQFTTRRGNPSQSA